MKIERLVVKNFKAIEHLTLNDLNGVVLLTGANGVGKSCVLHAIRLLKSSYGGYSMNEWQNWFTEFGINTVKNRNDYQSITRDKSKPAEIEADFSLSNKEKGYLRKNASSIVEAAIWRSKTGNYEIRPLMNFSESVAAEHRKYKGVVENETKKALKEFNLILKKKRINGKIVLENGKEPEVTDNILLEILFSTYLPEEIGIIDYHGPNRSYEKENQNSVNVNLSDNSKDQYKNHVLYNYVNKYNNVKNEMISSYIRALVSKESGAKIGTNKVKALNESFQELFNTFFENKIFDGLVPTENGTLLFPVRNLKGSIHDINDLSSGEKELLFGYVRLINSSPSNSIILIDEPELHLNPKMAKKLPLFYAKHFGENLNNQIWLVTHSDAMVKEVSRTKGFSVYRMIDANLIIDKQDQALRIELNTDLESTLVDLVGNVSEFIPGEKVVVLESENSEFDKEMITSLFPDFTQQLNFISGGNKSNVRGIYRVLQQASTRKIINKKFFAITDQDFDIPLSPQTNLTEFSWDVYHIENYLLNERFIHKVIFDLGRIDKNIDTPEKINAKLKTYAKEDIDFYIRHELQVYVNKEINDCLKYREKAPSHYEAFSNSIKQINKTILMKEKNELSKAKLKLIEVETREKLLKSLRTNEWKSVFRGRETIRALVSNHCKGIDYISFRNLIISEMKRDSHKPQGMKKILEKIIQA